MVWISSPGSRPVAGPSSGWEYPVTTDEKTGEATVRLTLIEGGRYVLRASGEDRFGQVVSAEGTVQVSDDKDFIFGVRTLFNNDHDNSAGLGVGKDWQYVDEYAGEVVYPAKHTDGTYRADRPVRARYVRFYSSGNTSNDQNHYTEAEIYGTPRR